VARYLGEDEEGWDRRFRVTLEDPEGEDAVLIRFDPRPSSLGMSRTR
jgi:hypothetical protein